MKVILWLMSLATITLSIQADAAPSSFAWRIAHGTTADRCIAYGPDDGKSWIALGTSGPHFAMLAVAPEFQATASQYEVTLSFDGQPGHRTTGDTTQGALGIPLDGDEISEAVMHARTVVVTVEGRSHEYALAGAAAALDTIARCAGQPILAERLANRETAIPGAGDWKIAATATGAPTKMCVVHILGPEIDTMMVYNERKELVLIAGNMGWKLVPEKLSLQLSIDGGTAIPQEPRTNASGHLVEILLGDGETLHRLRNADMLGWIMPEGHFRGPVSGFGVALDALTKCQRG